MNRYIKRLAFMFLVACALGVPFIARGAVISVPSGITTIGDEAFIGLDAVDGVVVPRSVVDIGANAFGDKVIYGFEGSYAQQYAADNWLRFGALDIENAALSANAVWAAPGQPVRFTLNADCGFPNLTYRFYVGSDGWMTKDSGPVNTNTYEFTFDRSGAYSVWAVAYHPWDIARAELAANFLVPEPIQFSVNEARIAVGQSLKLISNSESRHVTLTSGNPALVEVNGLNVLGRALGTTVVTATVVDDLGEFSERFVVEVIVPVESIAITNSASHLQIGETAVFQAQISPWNATDQIITWSSSDPFVASVDQYGVVTANAQGACLISCEAGGKRASVPINCAIFVREISISASGALPVALYTHNTFALAASVSPWDAHNRGVNWSSLNTAVAVVDASGVVTCVGAGEARIVATAADGGGASAVYDFTVLQGPERVLISSDRANINLNEYAYLSADILPSTAPIRTLTWSSSNTNIARVSATGVVTPINYGTVIITATAHNGVYGEYTITVSPPAPPTRLSLNASTVYINPGETYIFSVTAYPENSIESYSWSSSATSIARVDANGVVTGVAAGSATISVISAADLKVSASARVVVLSNARTLVMPERRTAISGISSNLLKINSVLNSSTNELTALLAQGKITQTELNARKNVIAEAFKMYAFPWMTLYTQPYWKAANSENGAKDYQPGIVYYGIPYNSTYGAPRDYNVTKLLNENRFYKSSGSYYILNQNNLLNGTYCGNDCSAMLAHAFGNRISTSITWRTTEFYSDTAYFKTLSNPSDLRPGDIMVRDGRHVVMFLYYASPSKTQVVVIEQGGPEPAINTVSTGIYNISYFVSESYKGRRLKAWAS